MKKQNGQVALIVLIISAISLTIGLAMSDRIRTGVRINKDDEMLERAFNAAESGIDNYIARGDLQYVSDNASALVNVTPVSGTVVEFGEYTPKDDYAYFWLAEHNEDDSIDYSDHYDPDNSIYLCFDDFDGGLMVYYFGRNGANYNVVRRAYNLTADAIAGAEDVTGEGNVCSGYDSSIAYEQLTDLANFDTPLLMVAKPVGEGSVFALRGSASLPSQGNLISSQGASGETNTIVNVMKRWDPAYYMFFMLEGIVARDSIN